MSALQVIPTIRPLRPVARAMILSTTLLIGLVIGARAAGAQPADVPTEPASQHQPAPGSDSTDKGFRDLICKPNGTEDGFDCAVEPTPAKIVPIPSQIAWPRSQDLPVTG